MAGINFPQVNTTILPAIPSLDTNHNILFMGLSGTGPYVSGDLYLEQVNDAKLSAFVGADSPMGRALAIHRVLNPSQRVSFVPISQEPTGTAATATIVATGTATQSGDVRFKVGGHQDNFSISITAGDTPTVTATKIRNAINNIDNGLVVASGTGASITLTAKQKGAHGNYINILVYKTPLNITGTTFTLTEFSGGAGTLNYPTLESIADDYKFDTVAILEPDQVAHENLAIELQQRFNVQSRVLDGRLFSVIPMTANDADTITGSLKSNLSNVVLTDKAVNGASQKGIATKLHLSELVALMASFRQLKFTDGSDLSSYVQDGGSLDIVGGIHQSAKPYTNTILLGFEVPEVGTSFTDTESSILMDSGVSYIGAHKSGQYITFSELVTTYRETTQGVSDDSFKFLEVVDSASHARKYTFDLISSRYSQSALATSTSVVGFKIATAGSIEGTMMEAFATLAGEDYILYDEGGLAIYGNNLSVSLVKREGRVSIASVMPILTQLRRVDIALALTFKV
jgi:phage tail sheath gpL-like